MSEFSAPFISALKVNAGVIRQPSHFKLEGMSQSKKCQVFQTGTGRAVTWIQARLAPAGGQPEPGQSDY